MQSDGEAQKCRFLIPHELPMASEDRGSIQALERQRKHWRFSPSSALLPPGVALAMQRMQNCLILDMGIEDTRLDEAVSFYLYKQTIVARLRKAVGERNLRWKFPT